MKKLFTVVLAVAFALSVAGFAVAADEKKAAAPAAAPAPAAASTRLGQSATRSRCAPFAGSSFAWRAASRRAWADLWFPW